MVEDGCGPSKPPFGPVDIGIADGGAQIVDIEAVGGERLRVEPDAHGGPSPPLIATSPTPASCAIFCASRVSAHVLESVSASVFEVTASVRIGASAGLTLA